MPFSIRGIKKFFAAAVTVILMVIFSGCAIDRAYLNSSETNEALAILQKVQRVNSGLKTCKGSGWLTIADQKGFKKFRMAWAASFPDRIRLTLLSAGHPVETILADGVSVSFVSHTGNHKIKRLNSANPSLKDVVHISVTLEDVISVFAGKVPVYKFDTAEIAQITDSALRTNTVLMLKKRWNGESQNIVINPDGRVGSFSFKNGSHKLIHSVMNRKYSTFDSFPIPVKVRIKDNEGRLIDFEMTSYQPNIALKPDTFILTESR